MSTFLTWFGVMVVAISILGTILFIPNYISDLRKLKQDGVARPKLVMLKRILAVFVGGKKKRKAKGLLNLKCHELRDLPVWLSWDIRWVSSGTMLGKIIDVVDSNGSELLIEFSQPIKFNTDDVDSTQAVFKPNNLAALKRFTISGIYGSLRPTNEAVEFRDVITCEIVTFPKV